VQPRGHPDQGKRPRLPPWAAGALAALAALVAVAAGCSRVDLLKSRLDAIEDDAARRIVRDAIWAHGSVYRWAGCRALRADVVRTEHRPLGDTDARETWVADPCTGAFRIESPARREVATFDGLALRIFRDGRETADLEARGRAVGNARLVQELLAMPVSLAAPGCEVSYVGTRVGPGDARTWQCLLVGYGPQTGHSPDDRAVVEIRKGTDRVEAVLVRWSEWPFFGRRMRVEMDDWRPVDGPAADGPVVSRRWRFIPIDESGEPTGPARYTLRLERVETMAAVGPETFSRP